MNHLGVGQQQKKTVICNNTEVQLAIPQQPQNIQFTRQPHVVYCAIDKAFLNLVQLYNCITFILTQQSNLNSCLIEDWQGSIDDGLDNVAQAAMVISACVIPLLMDDCRDAVHLCPVCQAEVGRKNFIFE